MSGRSGGTRFDPGGGGGGGLVLRSPVDEFTGATLTACRTARDTYFNATANAAALAQFQADQFLAIVLNPTTGDDVFETYAPGNSGAYDNTKWLTRTDAVQGPRGLKGDKGDKGDAGADGGLSESEVDARVEAGVANWAEEGNSDAIPAAKLVNAPSGGGGGDGSSGVFLGAGDIASDGTLTLPGTTSPGENDLVHFTINGIDAAGSVAVLINHNGNTYSLESEGASDVTASDFVADTDYIGWRRSSGTQINLFGVVDGGLSQSQVDGRVRAGVEDWAEQGNTEAIPASKLVNAPGGGGGGGGGGLTTDQVDARVRAIVDDFAETAAADNIQARHRLEQVPELERRTHDLLVESARTWSDAGTTTTIQFTTTDTEPTTATAAAALTYGSAAVTLTDDTAGNVWVVWKVAESGVDLRNYRLKLVYPANGGTRYLAAGGDYVAIADGFHYYRTRYYPRAGLTITMESDAASSSTHYRGKTDAAKVQVSGLTERLSGSSSAAAALAILDKFEVVDITDGSLPAASADTAGKLYIDRLHRSVHFTVETRVAQTLASATWSDYTATDVANYLGMFASDTIADNEVGNNDSDVGKFYWSTSQHVFRTWTRTTLLGGIFDYHWATEHNVATRLADAQGFDHADAAVLLYYVGYGPDVDVLTARVPATIADGSRVYGVTPANVHFLAGSDYTAPVNYSDTFDWATLGVSGSSGVTVDALNTAIASLRTEIVAGAPANRNTLEELASALAAAVTNTAISTVATAESTSVAPSRRQVATALADVRADIIEARASRDVTGETGRRVPTLLYSDSTGTALGTSNTALVNIDVDEDPDDFEVLLIEVKITGNSAINTLPMRIYPAFREGGNWPTTETSGTGVLVFDTVSNTGLVNIWSPSATRLTLRKGGSQAGWASVTATIHRVWGVATVDDWLALATGTDYALIPGAEVTLGGTNSGEASASALSLADVTQSLLGYETTVTGVSVEHSSGQTVTLMVHYTTRAPSAGIRPAGIDFLAHRFLVADSVSTVSTDSETGISTVSLSWTVPSTLASSVAEVDALRSATAYSLHWLIPFTTMVEGARLPAAAADRDTNARAEFNATTRQWTLVDAESADEGADQTDVHATIILWGRFASEPTAGPNATWGDSGYAGLQSHADIGTGGAWQISEEDANLQGDAANPLYMAIAQATRTSGVWAQSPEWAIVPVDLPTQYSADGVNWHATYNAATDSWLRYRTSSGAWSRPLTLLGPQAVLHWTTLLDWTFNNNQQGAVRSITPTWLNQFREMRVEALEFADWPSYVANAFEQVREARIGLDHVEVLAHTVDAAAINAGVTNNPIACRFDANEAFIGLGSDTDLSSGGVRWPFNFSFVFRGPNANQADEVLFLARPPNWSWCRVKIGVR